MTREEFIKVLEEEGYSYEIEGDKIVVTENGNVWLESLTSLPSGVVFKNRNDIRFPSLEILPPGVVFKNRGVIHLVSLKIIPPGVEFKNKSDVKLSSTGIGYFNEWKGNIEGIDSKRLLNGMIKRGLFL